MTVPLRPNVAVAIVRMLVEPGMEPVIRIIEMPSIWREERVVLTTTSTDAALDAMRSWITDATARVGDRSPGP
jgi:hypothetical protein